MEASATIARRLDAIAAVELFHSCHHLRLIRTAIIIAIELRRFGIREEGGRRIGDGNWRGRMDGRTVFTALISFDFVFGDTGRTRRVNC